MESVRTPTGQVLWRGQWTTHTQKRTQELADERQHAIEVWLDGKHNGTYLFTIKPKPQPNKESKHEMARHKGYFIDYLVETTDPDFRFEVKRIYFTPYEQKAYYDFVKGHPDRVVAHGKRYS